MTTGGKRWRAYEIGCMAQPKPRSAVSRALMCQRLIETCKLNGIDPQAWLAEERLVRIEHTIAEFLPGWSLAPVVDALQVLLGIDLVVAASFVVAIGDIRRFEKPRKLMGYLGLVPEERSTGQTVRRGSITKMGNPRIRQLLVESAWTYRFPPRVGVAKLQKLDRVSPKIREIAWKAQSRLTARFRAFSARGMKLTVVCTAIARELVGFMWAVAMEAHPPSPSA